MNELFSPRFSINKRYLNPILFTQQSTPQKVHSFKIEIRQGNINSEVTKDSLGKKIKSKRECRKHCSFWKPEDSSVEDTAQKLK